MGERKWLMFCLQISVTVLQRGVSQVQRQTSGGKDNVPEGPWQSLLLDMGIEEIQASLSGVKSGSSK